MEALYRVGLLIFIESIFKVARKSVSFGWEHGASIGFGSKWNLVYFWLMVSDHPREAFSANGLRPEFYCTELLRSASPRIEPKYLLDLSFSPLLVDFFFFRQETSQNDGEAGIEC